MEMKMEIGKKYLAIQPAHSFGEIDGEQVNFEEKRIEIEVLPKPKQVVACDGETEVCEALPDHLKGDDWYNVRNLKTGNTHWLNKPAYQISALQEISEN